MVVKSIAELQKAMMDMVNNAIEDTSDFLIKETTDMIKKTVYDAYIPIYYDRTHTLEYSVGATNKSYCSITIGHFPSYWHSIQQGVINEVPQIVTSGSYGTYIGMGENQHGEYIYHNTTPDGSYGRPRPYMDRTVEELKSGNKYLKHLANNINANVKVV